MKATAFNACTCKTQRPKPNIEIKTAGEKNVSKKKAVKAAPTTFTLRFYFTFEVSTQLYQLIFTIEYNGHSRYTLIYNVI